MSEVMKMKDVLLIDSHCHLEFIFRRMEPSKRPRSFRDFRASHANAFPKSLHSIVNVQCQPEKWLVVSPIIS